MKVNRWTDEQLIFLKENHAELTGLEISKVLGRSVDSVRGKASELGLKKTRKWTKEEEEFLKNNYEKMTDRELGESLNRTTKSIDPRMRKLNLKRNIDLSGKTFGRLLVVNPTNKRSGSDIVWKCKCQCNGTAFIMTSSLTSGKTQSCGCLKREVSSKNGKLRKYNLEKQEFGDLKVIKDSGERRNSQVLWECICKCGRKKFATSYYLKKGITRSCGVGSCHNAYNHSLTDEDRILNRDVTENLHWRRKVFERDGYKCTMCGDDKGGNLNAHHLNSWGAFPEERFHISNGRTLCTFCHLDFHKEYGYKNNTKKQFEEYMESKKVML